MLKRSVQLFFRSFGYKLVTLEAAKPSWGLTHFFPLLRESGFSPSSVWDVGANRGDWSRAAVRYFAKADYTLIEPQDHLKNCVEDLVAAGHKIRWINAGASDQPGTFPLRIFAKDQSSSFLDNAEGDEVPVRTIEVPVRTLDEIQASFSLPVPELLKIDAEGYDLKVLRGASNFVGQTEIILIEVAIGELRFENSVHRVLSVMDGLGYRLLDVTDLLRTRAEGLLWMCEFAFIRKSSRRFQHMRY